jgi:hypothetical protein
MPDKRVTSVQIFRNVVAISIIIVECLIASLADILVNLLEICGSEATPEKTGTIEECRIQAHR